MDHPVVKWTLNPRTGQRRWTESEADVVLKDLRTNVRVYDVVQQVEKKEGGGNKEVNEEEAEMNEGEEERGGVVAAVFGVAAGLVFGVDETNSKAWEVPPFPDDEILEYTNEDTEETETGYQAKEAQDSIDDGEKVILVVVASPRSYTCGRCSKGIDLDSTFYRCVGHSCRGAFTPQSWIFEVYLFYDFSLRFFHLRTMRVHFE